MQNRLQQLAMKDLGTQLDQATKNAEIAKQEKAKDNFVGFKSLIPNMTVVVGETTQLCFIGNSSYEKTVDGKTIQTDSWGEYVTSDPEIIKQLRSLCKSPGSKIYEMSKDELHGYFQ